MAKQQATYDPNQSLLKIILNASFFLSLIAMIVFDLRESGNRLRRAEDAFSFCVEIFGHLIRF
jgi:hypothetical protein